MPCQRRGPNVNQLYSGTCHRATSTVSGLGRVNTLGWSFAGISTIRSHCQVFSGGWPSMIVSEWTRHSALPQPPSEISTDSQIAGVTRGSILRAFGYHAVGNG